MSDAKVISINRTPGDFVKDTRHLSVEDRGAYQEILDQIVILGQDADPPSLPDDDRVIANMLGWSVQKWRKTKARLCGRPLPVLIVAGGRISQIRIAVEIEEARNRISASYIGGKASGASRRAKAEMRERMLNRRSTDVEPDHELDANQSLATSHESQKEPLVPKGSVARTTAKEQVESYVPGDQQRQWAAENTPAVEIDSQTERWRDYLRANGYRTRTGPVKDAAASWRNWMANEQKWGRGGHGKPSGNGRTERGRNSTSSESAPSRDAPTFRDFGGKTIDDVLPVRAKR